jgi:hypothetical protein
MNDNETLTAEEQALAEFTADELEAEIQTWFMTSTGRFLAYYAARERIR